MSGTMSRQRGSGDDNDGDRISRASGRPRVARSGRRARRRPLVDGASPATRSVVARGGRAGHGLAAGRERGAQKSMNPDGYIVLSAILFTIGAVGFMLRRNAIVAFMCVELMLNAANLALVTFSRVHGELDGQVAAFFVMVVAAAEVVVGLAIIVTIFRTRRSASVDDANLLKF